MWSRRAALGSGLAAGLLAGLGGRPVAHARGGAAAGPRYVVTVFLRGGMDAIFTTDPKDRAEVDPRVDIAYAPDDVIESGDLRVGPHLAPIRRHLGRFAVLKGLQVRTANHESGALQMLRLKTAVSPRSPSILEIIGARRDGQPLASVTLGRTSSLEHSPASLGAPTGESDQTLFDALDDVRAGDFGLLERVYAEHLEQVASWPAGLERDQTEEHLRQVRDLFARLEDVPSFKAEDWDDEGGRRAGATDLQRVLWLLEHDLTRCAYLKIYLDWDSHYDNDRKQTSASGAFFPQLARFLDELDRRSNAHGRLSDNTLLVMGSELGRFPFLNGNQGKDHFPETSLMLAGPGIASGEGRGAAYGQTGRLMEGLPVSLETGRPADNGALLTLDDVGATLLGLVGLNPELYGYRGRRLRFLEAA